MPYRAVSHGSRRERRNKCAAVLLSLAAAPTFAVMALLSHVLGGVASDALCSAEHGSTLTGMASMYALMSTFHLAPWLKLMGNR